MNERKRLTVKGRLFHHFHGHYSCTIALGVERGVDDAQTERFMQQLIAQLPIRPTDKDDKRVLLHPTDSELQMVADWIEQRRVDPPCEQFDCHPLVRVGPPKRHAIGSIAHSIDAGPIFEFELPFIDLLTPSLF